MSTRDPLKLLIACCSARKEIHLLRDGTRVDDLRQATSIALPDPAAPAGDRIVLPKDTPTRYLTSNVAQPPYDLQALVACWLTKDAGLADAIRQATQWGTAVVGVQLKPALLQVLEGRRQPDEKEVLPDETAAADMAATADGTSVDPSPRPTKKARYVVDKNDLIAVKAILAAQEPRQLNDRKRVLRGAKPNNFESVRTLVSERIKAAKEELHRSSKAGPLPTPAADNAPRKRMDPIIIVSPSSSALITMQNVKQFLEEGIFTPVQPNAHRSEDVVSVLHKRHTGGNAAAQAAAANKRSSSSAGGVRTARYLVIDSIGALTKFGDEAWERVVCVMTTGQEWQFQPYKWTEPKELFHHVKGVYFQYTNAPVNDKVKGWNVTMLKIDPAKRYIDKSVVAEFWRIIEAHCATNKSWLSY